jgi:hypothetical protein
MSKELEQVEIPELREFDAVKRELLGPVLIPSRFDGAGDGMSVEEVIYACRWYNDNAYGSIDINHELEVDCVKVLESYILEYEMVTENVTLPAGTWMMRIKVDDTTVGDLVWGWLLDGTLNAFSPEGACLEHKVGSSDG